MINSTAQWVLKYEGCLTTRDYCTVLHITGFPPEGKESHDFDLFCVQVVVHGTSEATNHMVDFARKALNVSDDKVVAPHIGEPVNGTTESHIYQVGGLLSIFLLPCLDCN